MARYKPGCWATALGNIVGQHRCNRKSHSSKKVSKRVSSLGGEMTNSQLTNFHSNLSHRETFAIAIVLVHLVHLVLAFEKFQEFLRDSMMQHDATYGATYGAGYASSSASLDSSFTEKHLQSLLLCSCTRCLAKRKAQTLCVIDVFHCVSLCFTVFHCVSLCFTVFHCVSLCFTENC